ncbi:DUF3604 domain-containing protein [Myxococcota bacterium]|nr:DUF3604 domain-containing protein [Myxococcota bacterium]
MFKKTLVSFVALMLLIALFLWIAGSGLLGEVDSLRVEPATSERSADRRRTIEEPQAGVARMFHAPGDSQILFGDLHVHTTISSDAFAMNLPIMGGGGAMNAADACDFARQCAALDFWSINDHANAITPADWSRTIDSIRACNDRSGDPANPDSVAFLGWEWTQAGLTPETHYGHKNVVLAEIVDGKIPSRPIAAKPGSPPLASASPFLRGALGLMDQRAWDLSAQIAAFSGFEPCPDGHVRDLPGDCQEVAPTPADLFRKLDEWGHEAIVIPHGTSWGIYTPTTASWDKQLEGAMHDPEVQTMIEIYSGHGDSEVYRDWRGAEMGEGGRLVCPEERPDYLPMCRRAGQIIEERCLASDESAVECAARAAQAREHAVAAGKDAARVVSGSSGPDWLDAGQCRDCNQPAFKYIPASSAQYIAALGHFEEGLEGPRRFRMGFMASSDNHSARPGTGYKEIRAMTDAGSDDPEAMSSTVRRFIAPMEEDLDSEEPSPPARSIPFEAQRTSAFSFGVSTERVQSFQYTGGLIAVHADGRDRRSIWRAFEANEIYGTSGPRILLWFDLLTRDGAVPMGSEVESDESPVLRVRAAGSFEQQPGCPEEAAEALGPDLLQRLCRGECYFPNDQRRPIVRIDVIRIRPQVHPDEDIADLIDDPWRSFDCQEDTDGCEATFTDPDFPTSGRDALYYARVFEAPLPTVNGTPLNCRLDGEGRCIETRDCHLFDECLAPDSPRAWSSPIYVDHPAARRNR